MPKTQHASPKGRTYGRTPKGRGQNPGKKNKGLTVCKTCGIYLTGKHWTHPTEAKAVKEGAQVIFTLCPACRMAKDGGFAGELVLKDFPGERKHMMLETIKNSGNQAFRQNPLHRVLNVTESKSQIRVLTTENQLAVRLGKEVERAFGGNLEIHWSKDDEPVYVVWKGDFA